MLKIAAPVVGAFTLVASIVLAAPAHAGDGVPERWEDVVECESGGDPNAVNPSSGAAGLYQFMPSTWDAYAPPGYPDSPLGASAHQQLVVAERVLAAQGADAWVCPGAPASSTDVSVDVSAEASIGDDSRSAHECRDPGDLAWESCDVLPDGRTQAEVYASASTEAGDAGFSARLYLEEVDAYGRDVDVSALGCGTWKEDVSQEVASYC